MSQTLGALVGRHCCRGMHELFPAQQVIGERKTAAVQSTLNNVKDNQVFSCPLRHDESKRKKSVNNLCTTEEGMIPRKYNLISFFDQKDSGLRILVAHVQGAWSYFFSPLAFVKFLLCVILYSSGHFEGYCS